MLLDDHLTAGAWATCGQTDVGERSPKRTHQNYFYRQVTPFNMLDLKKRVDVRMTRS